MPPHVVLTHWHWETSETKKGKQSETIVYEVPLPKVFKTRVIDVWNQFEKDLACKLTVRGRKEDGYKRVRLEEKTGAPVEKIHHVIVKLLENERQSREERLLALSEAEKHVDAFLRNMLRSPADQVSMFPPEDAGAPKETGTVSAQQPSRLGIGKEFCVDLKEYIHWLMIKNFDYTLAPATLKYD